MINEKGFTLIEMLIVLMIISVLILITIPNVMKHFQTVDDKGCEAYTNLVQSQVQAYKVEHKKYPSLQELVAANYLAEGEATCPDGSKISIDGQGKVTVQRTAQGGS